jgi:hypothetical protein
LLICIIIVFTVGLILGVLIMYRYANPPGIINESIEVPLIYIPFFFILIICFGFFSLEYNPPRSVVTINYQSGYVSDSVVVQH